MGKLENLLNFEDFEKSWNPKSQKSTKRTEVGLDVLNENLYMKVMDQTSSNWKKNIEEFIGHIKKSINENQVSKITVNDKSVTFTIRERKHRVNKDDGSITLWRVKATAFRKKYTDEAGRVKEEKKRTKTREEIEVTVPIGEKDAKIIYNALKERAED